MNIEKQRKAFEAWAYSNKWNIFRVRDMGLDHYVDDFVNGAWHSWLAAQKQEDYVLVPVEPTDKTITHMINTPIEVNLLCDHADVFLSEGEAYIAYQAMIQAAQE